MLGYPAESLERVPIVSRHWFEWLIIFHDTPRKRALFNRQRLINLVDQNYFDFRTRRKW